MQPDMWSGWGNPHALGATQIVQPLQLPDRRGLAARQRHHCGRLPPLRLRHRGGGGRRSVSAAASHFLVNQLPELYAGLQREERQLPGEYIGANVPQAWAAGTPSCC